MTLVLLQGSLVVINLLLSTYNYEHKNYKTAMFNCFAAGVCFTGLIRALTLL